MNEQWALLWSKRQNCFHIETVSGWLSKNRTAYRDNASLNDYHPIYIGDKETCHITADSIRSTIAARELARPEKVAI
jgi:hypothetical protein